MNAAGKTCTTIGSWTGAASQDQFFTYLPDGSMASNSFVGTYDYTSSPVAHAPKQIAGGDVFSYDANGNMTTGLNGKVMAYDGENRPLRVTSANGDVTEYVYGADGSRLKRTVTEGVTTTTSLYFGEVEIVNPATRASSAEVVNWYPHPNVKIAHTRIGSEVTYLHRNQLESVVLIADATGGEDLERIYEPFGADTEYGIPNGEDKGFIGERKDAVAGLHYLNARYYDPELAMFIQPDWFEVTLAGVGTNR